jgi:hypothetical protein
MKSAWKELDVSRPTCPLWRAASLAKARNRQELAALPPAQAQACVSHGLPSGGAKRVKAASGSGTQGFGLAGILAGK